MNQNESPSSQRKLFTISCLAAASSHRFSPVQLQKVFFLLDRRLAGELDGPHFNFEPYLYGPFDKDVYYVVEALVVEGLMETVSEGSWKSYRLTPMGQRVGEEQLANLSAPVKSKVQKIVNAVCKMSFRELVSFIYREYPEMRAKSVFT